MDAPLSKPALPPPPGVTSDLGTSSSVQPTAFGVSIALMVIASILVALRLYVKIFLIKKFQYTDVVTILAWLFTIALCVTFLIVFRYGYGRHGWDISLQNFQDWAYFININEILYQPTMCITKVAILMQLQDIFAPTPRTLRWWLLNTLIAVNCVFFLLVFFFTVLECTPRKKIWIADTPGTCINIKATFIATGAITVADDLVMLVLPLCWVWDLSAPMRRKLFVMSVFATGTLAFASSVVRLCVTLINVNNPDVTYALVPESLWSFVEASVGVIVVCMPTLPRLFRQNKPVRNLQGSSSNSKGNDSGHMGPTLVSRAKSKKYTEINESEVWTTESVHKLARTADEEVELGRISGNAVGIPQNHQKQEFGTASKTETWQVPHTAWPGNNSKPGIMKTVSVTQHRT
ncbi:MAG: hypothetical protein M1820_004197 [Bogoriella megaspora]|nr:MAG: hypothetical protein M1820_004197 [Bogoriella megaspora]